MKLLIKTVLIPVDFFRSRFHQYDATLLWRTVQYLHTGMHGATSSWLRYDWKPANENFTERNVFRLGFSLSDKFPIKIKTRSTFYIIVYISFRVQYMVKNYCFWSQLLFFRFYEQSTTFDQLFNSNFLKNLLYHTPTPRCNSLWLEPKLIFRLGDWYFRLISPWP